MEWGIVERRVGVLLLNYDHRDAQHVADPGQKQILPLRCAPAGMTDYVNDAKTGR
jgi:hypothetical protein